MLWRFLRRNLDWLGLLFGYLNSNVFLPPLSAAEEADCLRRMAAGDAAARDTLIEHNLRLVAHVCKKFETAAVDRDDLISIGTIGLIKGVDSFRAGRGARLATYAARCIENEILMCLRADKGRRGEVSLYDPLGVDKEGNPVTLLDILSSGEEELSCRLENEAEAAELLASLSVLSERERRVLCCRYGLSGEPLLPQREVAARLGISRSYVSRIEKKAVQKLFSALTGK